MLENKIEDLEYVIDNLDITITMLAKYKQYNKEVADLKIYKSALEFDLDKLKEEAEELAEEEQKQARNENIEQEKQYLKEVI